MFNPRIKRLIIVVILLLLVVLLVVGGLKFSKQYTLKRTASNFVTNVLNNDSTASYDQFSVDGQKNTDKQIWKFQVERFSQVFKGQDPEFYNSSIHGKYTVVSYRLNGSDKNNYLFTVTLSGNTFSWKVESFTSNVFSLNDNFGKQSRQSLISSTASVY